MDIEILLALQNFRNGGGAFLTGWVSERRFVGFSTDGPYDHQSKQGCRRTAELLHRKPDLCSPDKNGIPGSGGTDISCFVQLLYVTFIFPWCLKYLERPAAELSK